MRTIKTIPPVQVSVPPGTTIPVVVTPSFASNVYAGSTTIAFGASADLILQVAGVSQSVFQVACVGDSDGVFTLFYNGVFWGTRRNSWNERQVFFSGFVKSMAPGDTIRVAVLNTSQDQTISNYEATAYYG